MACDICNDTGQAWIAVPDADPVPEVCECRDLYDDDLDAFHELTVTRLEHLPNGDPT